MSQKTLNILIRFRKGGDLRMLDEALFSLAVQTYPFLHVIISVKNMDSDLRQSIQSILDKQPWATEVTHKLVAVSVAHGEDGRSHLINEGLKHTQGSYLAFLDYDDVVYQHAYQTLISELEKNPRDQIAVGGSRIAILDKGDGFWFVESKNKAHSWGKDLLDLFKDNFIPIHSYVVHMDRAPSAELYFDESLD